MRWLSRGSLRTDVGQRLRANKPRIVTPLRQKRAMRARFHDGPTIHDTYKVGILYSRKPMCDYKRCAVFGEFGQRLLHEPFRFGIQCAGCLIEQQDRRILDGGV